MSDFILRPLAASDFDAWHRLWQGYLTFYESSVDEEVTRASFEAMIDRNTPGRTATVAEKDDELIGFVHLIYHAHNWHKNEVCYLQDLFVSEAARGLGVGQKLIESSYEQAEDYGAATVYWTTQDFNHTARKLYDRIGKLTPFIKYQKP